MAGQKRTWYNRKDAPALDALPSAAAQIGKPMRAPRKKRSGVFRRLLGGIALLLVFCFLAVASIFAFIREDQVTAVARQQIAVLAGEGYSTNITFASIKLFSSSLAGLEINGISVRNSKTGLVLFEGNKGVFSISLLGLLNRSLEITDLSLFDAEMHLDTNSSENDGFYSHILEKDGLVDPVLIAKMLDNAAQAISSRLTSNPDLVINASNVKLHLGPAANKSSILIETVKAAKAPANEFAFSAALSTDAWKTKVYGAIDQNAAFSQAPSYRVTLEPIPFSQMFAPQAPEQTPRKCSGALGLAVASNNGLTSLDASFSDGNCSFGRLGDYKIDATIRGELKDGRGIFEIGKGAITVNRSVFNFEGAIAPARYTPIPEAKGETPRYRYELVFAPSTMDSLDNTGGPLPLEGKISGTYAPSERRLAIDEFLADANGSILSGAASLMFTDVTPALYLALSADTIPVSDFRRIWPRFAAPIARQIFMDRVTSGKISNMRFELQLPPGKIGSKLPFEPNQLNASGDFQDASFNTFGDLPPVKNGKGRLKYDGLSLDIQLQSGTVALPSGGTADLENSSFSIADTQKAPVLAELKIDIAGKAEVIAEIASKKPVNALEKQGISLENISGNAKANGRFLLTLVPKGQPMLPPIYDLSVDLKGVNIPKLANGEALTNAFGSIKASNVGTELELDAEINGLPAKISIFEPQDPEKKRTQEIFVTFSDAWRNKHAPGLKSVISGPISAKVSGSPVKANVDLDLSKASLKLLPFNWEKGAGISAKASFNFERNGEDISIDNFVLSGRGLEASGKVLLKNQELVSAQLRDIRLNPGDSFSLGLKKQGQSFVASLSGNQFDARSLMKQFLPGRESGKTSNGPLLEITGDIQRLLGFNDEVLLDAKVGLASGKGTGLTLKGNFENGGSVSLSRLNNSAGQLVVQTSNAGAALRFVDLYKRMIGGSLALNFSAVGDNSLEGAVSISDFIVTGEPRLAKLVNEQAEGSASLNQATNADLANEKASFELAQGNIRLQNGSILLKSGIIRGTNVGATAEGVVLSATGKMDLRGTFMPARGLNRIVGAIPILGFLLGSGSNAGLIGITYQLAGNASNPRVFVNPISLIAPGVFRQIFE